MLGDIAGVHANKERQNHTKTFHWVCKHHLYTPALGLLALFHDRYMSRRCIFLENLPAFNFNSGIGERALLRKHKRGPRGKRYTAMHKCTNTVLLGSTLMKAMLDEVSEICEQNDHNWSQKAHQQVYTMSF